MQRYQNRRTGQIVTLTAVQFAEKILAGGYASAWRLVEDTQKQEAGIKPKKQRLDSAQKEGEGLAPESEQESE
jgi:hypothetical protein